MIDLKTRVEVAAANLGTDDQPGLVDAILADLTVDERNEIVRDTVVAIIRRHARPPKAERDPRPTPQVPAPRPTPPVPSPKVAAIRDWWGRFVSTPVSVGGSTKPIGDCTIPDLEALGRLARDEAIRHAVNADRFAAIAARMRETGAQTVRHLPREQIRLALTE